MEVRKTELLETLADRFPAQIKFLKPAVEGAPTHAELARQALLAGKHVFVEKPLAQTAEQAKELVEIADDRGLVLMVGHLLIYHAAFRFGVESSVRMPFGG